MSLPTRAEVASEAGYLFAQVAERSATQLDEIGPMGQALAGAAALYWVVVAEEERNAPDSDGEAHAVSAEEPAPAVDRAPSPNCCQCGHQSWQHHNGAQFGGGGCDVPTCSCGHFDRSPPSPPPHMEAGVPAEGEEDEADPRFIWAWVDPSGERKWEEFSTRAGQCKYVRAVDYARLRERLDAAEAERDALKYPTVHGRCPACGVASLFLGSGGWLTCSSLDCPNPTRASTALAEAPDTAGPADQTAQSSISDGSDDHQRTDSQSNKEGRA